MRIEVEDLGSYSPTCHLILEQNMQEYEVGGMIAYEIIPLRCNAKAYLADKHATKKVLSAECSSNGRRDSGGGAAARGCGLRTQICL